MTKRWIIQFKDELTDEVLDVVVDWKNKSRLFLKLQNLSSLVIKSSPNDKDLLVKNLKEELEIEVEVTEDILLKMNLE